jgi:hypothetical protein
VVQMTWRSEGPAQNLCRSAGPSAPPDGLRVLLPPAFEAVKKFGERLSIDQQPFNFCGAGH